MSQDEERWFVVVLVGEDPPTAVAEGWWHPNCNSGKVHDHPERPGGNWSAPMHRLCEQVYTHRTEPRTEAPVHALSRRTEGPEGPFTGPWGMLTEEEADELARAFTDDPREGGKAVVAEVFRFDNDPVWTEG